MWLAVLRLAMPILRLASPGALAALRAGPSAVRRVLDAAGILAQITEARVAFPCCADCDLGRVN